MDDVMTPTVTTPTAMPPQPIFEFKPTTLTTHIRFYMILDHVKSNMVLLGWLDVTNSHTNCSANSIPLRALTHKKGS
jgi:hypothetical protein